MYDMIIKGGRIVDGSGNEPYTADVAIKDGKIAKIGTDLGDGERVIDATGLVVTPGFIDSHSHADTAVFTYPEMKEKVEQGITTAIMGKCGSSPAPLSIYYDKNSDKTLGEYGREYDICKTMSSFLAHASSVAEGCNLVPFVGHGAIRSAVMGAANREPSAEELEKMKEFLRDAMKGGAHGMSLGLYYTPGNYAKTEELIELAKVVAEEGGMISAHIRTEGDNVLVATEEFIRIVKESGVRGVHSHIKAGGGKQNHGKMKDILALIDKANAEGADIYCDVYPYIASNTSLTATFVPPELMADGYVIRNLKDPEKRAYAKSKLKERYGDDDLSWVLVVNVKNRTECLGKRISEIAKERGCDAYDAVFDIIIDSNNYTGACFFTMAESDVEMAIKHPRSMICTDSGVARDLATYHPRLRASFPRAIGRYARDRGILPLHEIIRKVTSLPAQVYGLNEKGLIKEGYDADICIFDADRFIDRAEFVTPKTKCDGLNYVIVSGEVVAEDAVHNGKRCARVLRKGY